MLRRRIDTAKQQDVTIHCSKTISRVSPLLELYAPSLTGALSALRNTISNMSAASGAAKKKLVVAGGNGFLGSRICKSAVARGWDVTSIR